MAQTLTEALDSEKVKQDSPILWLLIKVAGAIILGLSGFITYQQGVINRKDNEIQKLNTEMREEARNRERQAQEQARLYMDAYMDIIRIRNNSRRADNGK